MWVIKSIGLGLLTVIAALFVLLIAILVTLLVLSRRYAEEGAGIGWDPVSLVRQQPMVVTVLIAVLCLLFASGFTIGYRLYHAH